jgi:hypothetical protein
MIIQLRRKTLIQTSKIFRVSSDVAGYYVRSLQRDETVSGWEDLEGDPTIQFGDRVLLCRHRRIQDDGDDWPNLFGVQDSMVNQVARVTKKRGLEESKTGYVQVQLEESYRHYGDKTKDDRQIWWRTRDVIRLWPDTFTACSKCSARFDVPLKTPYDAVPRLCTVCSLQKPLQGAIQAIEDAKFLDCLNISAVQDGEPPEQHPIPVGEAQTPSDQLVSQQESSKAFIHTRLDLCTRAELKAKIEELQERLDKLGPEGNLVDVSDLSDWIGKPMGVPRIPKKYKVGL